MIHRVDVDVNMLGCANKLCAQQTPLVHTDVLFMRRIHARPAQAAREFEGREPMAAAIIPSPGRLRPFRRLRRSREGGL